MNTQSEGAALMTVEQAAAYLQIAVATLNKKRSAGGGPIFHKVTRLVRYRAADLDAWVVSGRRRSTSEAPASKLLAA